MSRVHVAILAFGALLSTTVASAEERPSILPSRDVDVTYEMARQVAPGKIEIRYQRSRWDVANGLTRVDLPSPGLYVLVDRQAHQIRLVREADRSILESPLGSAVETPGVARDAPFTRMADDTIAGVRCTEWATRDSGGRPTVVCITADGVLLRARDADRILVVASRVVYERAAASVFAVPGGYRVRNAAAAP